ncbi:MULTISPECIES: class F sortase [Streptomyces]|uniref:class F sortase n=1 Tax=Streptomyces TaxID=1883 RepID=UPI001409F09B|nr:MULTISPECIES: class F sortase [Streptomyces]MDH6228794.1 LPXTG-site transpeptidase (sortase) family protein [Streptomyces sp. MJP52]
MNPFPRRAFVTAAVGSLLAGCGGGRPPGGAGGGRSAGTAQSTRRSTPPPSRTSPRASSGTAPRPVGRSVPVRLEIPAIGVDTPVMSLGLAPDRTVRVPPVTAHDRAGWYRHSPTPGQRGPSVILGHVTVGVHGDGVFRHLARLRAGDRIVARLENGTETVFTTDTVRTVAKKDFPTDAVYGDTATPQLRLVTCGGPLDDGEYRDNVIVFATLSSPPP